MKDQLTKIIKVLNLAERLKFELRHSWLSNGRRESVAEHSWRLSLMVVLIAPYLERTVDVEKCLKMSIVHDLVEAEVGDIPVFEIDHCKDRQQQKFADEHAAMQRIKEQLADATGTELYDLWVEFEERQSYEAKFVAALDKLECKLQHNEADLSTWNDIEKSMDFDWCGPHYDFDSTISLLRDMLRQQGIEKVLVKEQVVA